MKRNHSLHAAIGLTLMAIIAPIVHFGIFPSLIDLSNQSNTLSQISSNNLLFWMAIIGLLVVALLDIWVAFSLRKVFHEVNPRLSYRAFLFRVFYALIFIVSLYPLVKLAIGSGTLADFERFTLIWDIGLIVFGVSLILVGYLMMSAVNGSAIVGSLLMIAGVGYILDTMLVLADIQLPFEISMITFIGEVLLILWLFFYGQKRELRA